MCANIAVWCHEWNICASYVLEAYHPQTDGLVERLNWTLTGMLVKTVKEKTGMNVYHTSHLHTGQAARFNKGLTFLPVMGGTPGFHQMRLSMPQYLTEEQQTYLRGEWAYDCSLGLCEIKKDQQRQKRQHDKHLKDSGFRDKAFIYISASRCIETYKFSKPFMDPFCIASLYNNGA